MTSGGFEVYNADYDVKLRFGYITDDDDYCVINIKGRAKTMIIILTILGVYIFKMIIFAN